MASEQLTALPEIKENWWDMLPVLKSKIAPGVPEDEFMTFVYICKKRGLDPIQKQAYLVPRSETVISYVKGVNGAPATEVKSKKTIYVMQTGIDGFRLIAHRTKEYAGHDPFEFTYVGTGEARKILACKLTVYRMVQGFRSPFPVVCFWDEYKPPAGQDFMWRSKEHVMMAKCTEACGLRSAFPEDLSGFYVEEEFASSAHIQATAAADPPKTAVDAPQTDEALQPHQDTPQAVPMPSEAPTEPKTTTPAVPSDKNDRIEQICLDFQSKLDEFSTAAEVDSYFITFRKGFTGKSDEGVILGRCLKIKRAKQDLIAANGGKS